MTSGARATDKDQSESIAATNLSPDEKHVARGINVVDIVSGLLLIATALLALSFSWSLPLGTATSMGPGYVPRLLCYMQATLGGLIIAQGFMIGHARLDAWAPRPLVWTLASVTFFGLTIERLGLVVAVIGLVLLACVAHRGTRPHEAALLGGALALFAVLIFVKALGLPMQVWPHLGL